MSVVKLFVLLVYNIYVIQCLRNKYCDICVNHTLCIYNAPGPSKQCDKYEPSPITSREKLEIVNRINERRQLVAMGKLHPFPQAANMNKITWSAELANIAQRWADQCDHSVKPDKKDQCRDIVNVRVGQNIATVIGPSPGLSVRSMIDMWFMQNIFFTGSVTYYNRSSSTKTNYFTQLIWAETLFVGCGKVKFYMEPLSTVVARIVCNFAPRGNRDGKPIYIIGLPSTQCSHDTIPSNRLTGLCQRKRMPGPMFAVETSTVKSLLRILNFSNDSLKQELDPNNFKTVNLNYSEDNYLRNKKTRHKYFSNRYGAIKRDSFHIDPPIQSDNYKDHTHTPERGHSRMYHGHQTKKESAYSFEHIKTYTEQNLRRNDYTTTMLPYSEINYRRIFMNGPMECTRTMHVNENGCCSTNNQCVTNECTRGNNCQQHNCQMQQNPCLNIPCQPKPCQPSHQSHQNIVCSCNAQQGCSTPVAQCGHSPKCPYLSPTCAVSTPLCGFRRSEEDINKSTLPNYYDLFPNLEIKSGEKTSSPDIQHQHKELNNDYPILRKRKDNDNNKQITALHDMSQNKARFLNIPGSYHNFDSSAREKRDLEEKTFKPFWQVDDFIYKRPTDLKSMRYTTLPYRKRKKGFHQQAIFMTSTEPITITFKDGHRVTEKYLSFDELMHLRKFNDEEEQFYDALRSSAGNKSISKKAETKKGTANNQTSAATKAKTQKSVAVTTSTRTTSRAILETAVNPITTLTITANTPFIRVTSCTRKLTCTWTLQYMPSGGPLGSNGPNGPDGPNVDEVGTPPGYVDGCTRTSTCTRPFVNRNQWDMPKTDNGEVAPEEIPPEPGGHDPGGSGYEDYCERRDLNKRRRDLIKATTVRNINIQEIVTTPRTKVLTLLKTSEHPITRSKTNGSLVTKNYSNIRLKRNYQGYENLFKKSCFSNKAKLTTTSQQIYESSTSTILPRKRRISSKCPCNDAKSLQTNFWLLICILINLF